MELQTGNFGILAVSPCHIYIFLFLYHICISILQGRLSHCFSVLSTERSLNDGDDDVRPPLYVRYVVRILSKCFCLISFRCTTWRRAGRGGRCRQVPTHNINITRRAFRGKRKEIRCAPPEISVPIYFSLSCYFHVCVRS